MFYSLVQPLRKCCKGEQFRESLRVPCRLILMIVGLLLTGSAISGTAPSVTHTSFCQTQTSLMRQLATAGDFDIPPTINTLITNVIDGKLPKVREQLSAMSATDATYWRQSALTIATYAHQPAVVTGLLDDGAEVDGRGTIPGLKRSVVTQLFADAKRDPQWNSPNPDPKTALELRKAQLFGRNYTDAPILTIAANCDDVEILDIAFSHHANLAAQWPKNFNLLVIPVETGDTAIVKRLLDRGLDPIDGLQLATQFGHAAMVELLLDRGAEPCRADRAIRGPHVTVASLARDKGLNDHLVNRLTCTAFDKADTTSH